MTQREFYNLIIEIANTPEAADIEVIKRYKGELIAMSISRLDQLDKKKAYGKTKGDKTTLANVDMRNTIMTFLATQTEPLRVSEVADGVEITHARATALLTQLVKAGKVNREVIKKVPYFSIVTTEDSNEEDSNEEDS